MNWRGSTNFKDRFFGALVYVLPLIYVLPFGQYTLSQVPWLGLIFVPLAPLIQIYYGLPFASLIIFFALFFAVVRNERVSHFVRFNTMQAILIDILVLLCGFVLQILSRGLGGSLLINTLFSAVFLGTLVAAIYGIIQSARGVYAEIPTISEAAYSQVRY